MNMLGYSKFLIFSLVLLVISACKKEEVTKKNTHNQTINDKTEVIYGVNDVTVSQDGANKPNVKSTTEFVSIAFSDLFGTTISQQVLTDLSIAYVSFGDKRLVEDMIIKNFLNQPGITIPSLSAMNSNPGVFVENSYKKFYNRLPNEFEKWQLEKLIDETPSISPEIIYYSFMTSNEYRYY